MLKCLNKRITCAPVSGREDRGSRGNWNRRRQSRNRKSHLVVNVFFVKVGATGVWRKLHNEELHDLYSTHYFAGDKIRNNEIGGACCSDGGGERRVHGFGGET
jgi:hypothetical protein